MPLLYRFVRLFRFHPDFAEHGGFPNGFFDCQNRSFPRSEVTAFSHFDAGSDRYLSLQAVAPPWTRNPKVRDPKDVPPFGGLEYGITEEEIRQDMKRYAYVFENLKKC